RLSSGAIRYTPAALTSTSAGPFSSPAARVTAAATPPGSLTSQATGAAPMPAAAVRASARRSSSTASAPSARSRRAQASPIPPAPPVMIARRPAIRPDITGCARPALAGAVLAEPDATIDSDCLAGDVASVGRDQPGHHARDVAAGAVPAERDR